MELQRVRHAWATEQQVLQRLLPSINWPWLMDNTVWGWGGGQLYCPSSSQQWIGMGGAAGRGGGEPALFPQSFSTLPIYAPRVLCGIRMRLHSSWDSLLIEHLPLSYLESLSLSYSSLFWVLVPQIKEQPSLLQLAPSNFWSFYSHENPNINFTLGCWEARIPSLKRFPPNSWRNCLDCFSAKYSSSWLGLGWGWPWRKMVLIEREITSLSFPQQFYKTCRNPPELTGDCKLLS